MTPGRLLLASRLDHTVAALRAVAEASGTPVRVLAPGLLELTSGDWSAFLATAAADLTSVEAAEIRCAQVPADASEAEAVTAAMTAPSLSAVQARAAHPDMAALLESEATAFRAEYQPIVEIGDGRVVAFEALLRGSDASGATIPPATMFAAAEAAGWVHLLDRIGRTTALRDAGPWLGEDSSLFINFIPTSIYRPQVCLQTTERAARDAGLRLDQLVFEVTEGHQVVDVPHLATVFDYYRSRGCRVAIDDLGAGYSSLELLVRLQPDIVKLDKAIVQALPDVVAVAVVEAVVRIAHAYGGQVLAECVETVEQAEAAAALGVDLAQGWYYGRPARPSLAPARDGWLVAPA